jgi:hypothetical protein
MFILQLARFRRELRHIGLTVTALVFLVWLVTGWYVSLTWLLGVLFALWMPFVAIFQASFRSRLVLYSSMLQFDTNRVIESIPKATKLTILVFAVLAMAALAWDRQMNFRNLCLIAFPMLNLFFELTSTGLEAVTPKPTIVTNDVRNALVELAPIWQFSVIDKEKQIGSG